MLLSRVSTPVVDLDIWHEMALIREAFVQGGIPQVDHFAYTATLPRVIDHEWGAGVIAWLTARGLGAAGILALRYLLAALIGIGCFRVAQARQRDALPAFSLIAPFGIALVGAAFSPIRAHLYSLLFVTVLLGLLERDRAGDRRWIVACLAASVVWQNLHGGFVLGAIVLCAHGLEQALRGKRWLPVALAAIASLALVPLNPYGIGYYRYLWRSLTMARPEIGEWSPTWQALGSLHGAVFLGSLVFLAYLVIRLGWRNMPGIAILCAFAAAGALHQRMLPFFAVAGVAYLPGYFSALPVGRRSAVRFERSGRLQLVWLGIAIFFLDFTVLCRPWALEVPARGAADEIVYPVGAVNYLASTHFHGNLMTPFEYGAYVSWKLFPAVRVSLDSRYEVAYADWWSEREFQLYRAAPGWRKTLAAYPTDAVLVRQVQALAGALANDPAWKRVYSDASYEIYARPEIVLPVVADRRPLMAGRFP